jgi:hypothetical protein
MVASGYYGAATGISEEGYQASYRAAGTVLLVGVLLGLALAFAVTRPPGSDMTKALGEEDAQKAMLASRGPVWQQATLGARRSHPQDAIVGGSILGATVALLGFLAIATGPEAGIESVRSYVGWILLGLALALVASAVRGGHRDRYSSGGVVSVAFGGLLVLGYGLPLAILAVPLFVAAYLLLRSSGGSE